MAETARIGISRIYIKDLSFESPLAPELFTKGFQPNIHIDVAVKHQKLGNDMFEVTVEVTATGMQDEKKVFIVQVEQAGLFQIQGLEPDRLTNALKVYCPNLLFPYARTVIDMAMNQGSLPSLMLPPFNFETIPSAVN
jgi:preprotein translocase subunit SecB